MKKYTILFYYVFASILLSQNISSIEKIIEENRKTKLLKNASWSINAKYLETNKKIISYNSELSLAPASNMKIITSAAALEILGEEYRFVTKIYYDGKIDSKGNLSGNIYIVGGGDPALGFNLVKGSLPLNSLMDSWIAKIKEKGIVSVSGNIIADDLLYDRIPIPNNWAWIDLGNYYAPSVSALSIHNNLYYLFFEPGKKVDDEAKVLRTEPLIEGLKFTNFMKTGAKGSGDNGYIFNSPLSYNAVLRGTIPKGKNEFKIKGSIPNPPLFAAEYLLNKMKKNGITVKGKAEIIEKKQNYNQNKLLVKTYSPPLKDIVFILNKKSDNLYAEMLLRAIGLKTNGKASVESGIKGVEEYLNKNDVNSDGFIMHDGSGLSRVNSITTHTFVELLQMITQKKYFNSFYNSLPVVGDPNDISWLKNTGVGTEIEKNAHIKSGAIEGVRAYSGYLKDRNGKTIVFSLIANNFNGSGSLVSNIHKEIMIELAKLK